jgi:L-asparagine transporter-like permease
MAAAPALKKALNDRQLRMIAIGGVIGAGLFVGSGVVIGSTGPGAFIAYALRFSHQDSPSMDGQERHLCRSAA